MNKQLNRGVRKVKRNKMKVSDGGMVNLYHFSNGRSRWTYQIEYIKDTRFSEKPYVAVYAFNPKVVGCERADYYLIKEL